MIFPRVFRTACLVAAALSLSSCTGLLAGLAAPPGQVATAPASGGVLGGTIIDDQGIVIALHAYDALLDVVDALVATKVVKPGTPTALAIKETLIKFKYALKAASSAQRAGSTSDYRAALDDVNSALDDIRAAIKGVK